MTTTYKLKDYFVEKEKNIRLEFQGEFIDLPGNKIVAECIDLILFFFEFNLNSNRTCAYFYTNRRMYLGSQQFIGKHGNLSFVSIFGGF